MSVYAALVLALRARPRLRVKLQDLRTMWLAALPEQVGARDRDARLLEALRDLDRDGVIKLPAESSYERVGIPRMPMFVTVIRAVADVASRDWGQVPWHPHLGFWMTLSEKEKVFAERINQWLLTEAAGASVVPLRERALELFGDEKALDTRVRGKALFGGLLPISALKALLVPHPLPYRRAEARGAAMLVVENHHTFWSFAEWNQRSGKYAAVVYGSGKAFCSSGDALRLAMDECGAINAEYFGDLDPAGVAIPLRFMQASGTPLLPAVWLYKAALESGRSREGVNRLPHDVEHLRAWLPSLEEPISELWNAGRLIPQESVGTAFLSSRVTY